MIEKVLITDPTVIEQIRSTMPVATQTNKGLFSNSFFNSMNSKKVEIKPGETISLQDVCGLVIVTNKYINDGMPVAYIVGNSAIEKISEYSLQGLNVSTIDGTLFIKSNWSTAGWITIFYQSLLK